MKFKYPLSRKWNRATQRYRKDYYRNAKLGRRPYIRAGSKSFNFGSFVPSGYRFDRNGNPMRWDPASVGTYLYKKLGWGGNPDKKSPYKGLALKGTTVDGASKHRKQLINTCSDHVHELDLEKADYDRVKKKVLEDNDEFVQRTLYNTARSIGDSSTDPCGFASWYGFRAIEMKDIDRMMQCAEGSPSPDSKETPSFWLQSAANEITIKASSALGCQITVWRLELKRDLAQVVDGKSSSVNTIVGLNPAMMVSGVANQLSLTGPTDTTSLIANQFNCTPYYSRDIVNNCGKIEKILDRRMCPGDEQIITMRVPYSWKIDPTEFDLDTSGDYLPSENYQHMRNMGPIYLMRVQGRVVHKEDTSGSDASVVTVGRYMVDVVESRTATFWTTADTNTSRVGSTNTGLGGLANVTLAQEFAFAQPTPNDQPQSY